MDAHEPRALCDKIIYCTLTHRPLRFIFIVRYYYTGFIRRRRYKLRITAARKRQRRFIYKIYPRWVRGRQRVRRLGRCWRGCIFLGCWICGIWFARWWLCTMKSGGYCFIVGCLVKRVLIFASWNQRLKIELKTLYWIRSVV